MLTVAEAASLGQDRETIRGWIRSGRLRARNVAGAYAIDPRALRALEDELFPMAELPGEWKLGDDGSLTLSSVGLLHRSRPPHDQVACRVNMQTNQ
jgi:hypothetical protein